MERNTTNTRTIHVPPEKIYRALTDPDAIIRWQVPGDMTGEIHAFDAKAGGGYRMSLFYPGNDTESKGKTNAKEDKFTARFVELVPNKKVVEAINFDTSDPDLAGEMIMEISLEPTDTGTRVTFLFKNLPAGINAADNEAGTISSLEKLAKLVEQ